jgi:hypothetical protein
MKLVLLSGFDIGFASKECVSWANLKGITKPKRKSSGAPSSNHQLAKYTESCPYSGQFYSDGKTTEAARRRGVLMINLTANSAVLSPLCPSVSPVCPWLIPPREKGLAWSMACAAWLLCFFFPRPDPRRLLPPASSADTCESNRLDRRGPCPKHMRSKSRGRQVEHVWYGAWRFEVSRIVHQDSWIKRALSDYGVSSIASGTEKA